MGGEFGQHDEWCHFRSLDWHITGYLNHEGIRRWVRDLNQFYGSRPWLGYFDDEFRGFRWVNPDDGDSSVLSYLRLGNDGHELVLVVCNFTPVPRDHYRVGVPLAGLWQEVLNSDALYYGGGGQGNCGWKMTQDVPANGADQSLDLFLPPHSALIFSPAPSA